MSETCINEVKTTIEPSAYQLKRYEGNPILSPKAGSDWESEVTTNPAAWYDEAKG